MCNSKGRRALAVLAAGLLTLLARPTLTQTAGNYVIGPQDVIMITILEEPALSGRYTVEADGEFTFPLIGRIKAGGLSTRDFEAALKKRLVPDYFKNPQITVAIEQYRSQRVFVSGEVRSPGTVPLSGGMTLAEALARAGYTTPNASGELAIVRQRTTDPIRVSIKELETGDAKRNIELQDGDQIYALRAENIYVFGEVKTPGSYAVQKDTSVLQALALAGGATPNAALNRLKIVRIEAGKRIEIKAKVTDIVKPGDTIVVPEKFF